MQEQISKHIAGHSKWKQRLKSAIDTGQSEWDVAGVRPDNVCEFGKWLHSMSPAMKANEHYKEVLQFHAEFHSIAASVLELALAGKKAEAEKALEFGGTFATASVKLTQAMMNWKRSLGDTKAA
ncbi:MAG TPA: hypothetical protein ENJ00_03325 [Phycisphaerales bacterium]|nr:hypothetical protein [Phycisphaerales bacterium]